MECAIFDFRFLCCCDFFFYNLKSLIAYFHLSFFPFSYLHHHSFIIHSLKTVINEQLLYTPFVVLSHWDFRVNLLLLHNLTDPSSQASSCESRSIYFSSNCMLVLGPGLNGMRGGIRRFFVRNMIFSETRKRGDVKLKHRTMTDSDSRTFIKWMFFVLI